MLVPVLVVLLLLVVSAGVLVVVRPTGGGRPEARNPPAEYSEPGHCVVVLGEAGPRPGETVEALCAATDVGPAQAKDWVGSAPCAVAGGLSRASADRLSARLHQAGATAWVEDHSVA